MGLTGTCGAALDEERHFQLAGSGGGFRTDLTFDGTHQHLEEGSAALAFTYRPSALSFQVSAGAVLGGSLTGPLGDYDLKPGFLASAGLGYTFLDGTGPRPYLAVSGTLAISIAPTRSRTGPDDRPDLTATDLRASVVLGKRLFEVWLPYVGAAVFEDPSGSLPAGSRGRAATSTTTASPSARASRCPCTSRRSSRWVSSVSRRWSAGSAGRSESRTTSCRGAGPQRLPLTVSGRQSRGDSFAGRVLMSTTRTLVLLSMAVVMGCATEKSATEKSATEKPKSGGFALTTGFEVPPCPAAGPGAQGTSSVTLAPDEASITTTVTYAGLSGPATAAHIHAGKDGVAGPVVLPFSGDLTSPINKTFTAADYVAAPGAPPDFASFVQSLKSGGAYVNVHTAACKPGEIRGQIP